jgi:predicted acetyltransferase
MYNLPDNVTQADCDRYGSMRTEEFTRDDFIQMIRDNTGCDHSDAPESVQAEYQEWLQDDHGSLHADDDHEELWDKFCDHIAQHVQIGKVAA